MFLIGSSIAWNSLAPSHQVFHNIQHTTMYLWNIQLTTILSKDDKDNLQQRLETEKAWWSCLISTWNLLDATYNDVKQRRRSQYTTKVLNGESLTELFDFNMELERVISTMAKNVFWVTTYSYQQWMIIMNYNQSLSQNTSKDNDYASGSGAPCMAFSTTWSFGDLRDIIFIIGSLLKTKTPES